LAHSRNLKVIGQAAWRPGGWSSRATEDLYAESAETCALSRACAPTVRIPRRGWLLLQDRPRGQNHRGHRQGAS
jgi:hypothetical protein